MVGWLVGCLFGWLVGVLFIFLGAGGLCFINIRQEMVMQENHKKIMTCIFIFKYFRASTVSDLKTLNVEKKPILHNFAIFLLQRLKI